MLLLLVLLLLPGALPVSTSTGRLSQARRNIGAVAVGGKFFFAGGCTTTGSDPTTAFICNDASDVLDVLDAEGAALVEPLRLSEARGWPAACATDSLAVFAGGGKRGDEPHSRAADIVDVGPNYDFDGKVSSVPDALSSGRWGIACAAVNGTIFFPGGKVTISGYRNAYMSSAIDMFDGEKWSVAEYKLTVPRESAVAAPLPGGAAGGGAGGLVVAGGWKKTHEQYTGARALDIFLDPFQSQPGASGGLKALELESDAYDAGIAASPATNRVYIVGNEKLYQVSAGGGGTVTSRPLPADMKGPSGQINGGGAVPRAHVPQNGVAVGDGDDDGSLVCFYGTTPSMLYVTPFEHLLDLCSFVYKYCTKYHHLPVNHTCD